MNRDRRKKNVPIDFKDRRNEDRRKKNMDIGKERRNSKVNK